MVIKLNLSRFKFFKSRQFVRTLSFVLFGLCIASLLQILGYVSLPLELYSLSFIILSVLVFFNFSAREPGNLSAYSEVLNVLQLRDSLTQLPNHQLFLEHLEQGVSIANRQKKFMVVIKLDIDKLSEINQQYGYKKGDQIIRNLAMRLTDLTRESDNVARLSGSEFGLILNLIEHDGEADLALQRVMKEMRNPFLIENEDVILNISYGICVYPTEQGSVEDITKYASMALESAKKMGGNTHKYFDRV